MNDTDCTGAIYFTVPLRLALESFEALLLESGLNVDKGSFLLSIVHTEANFKKPLHYGDEVEIAMRCQELGTTSFAMGFILGEGIADVAIVFVAIDRKTKKSIALPRVLVDLLKKL